MSAPETPSVELGARHGSALAALAMYVVGARLLHLPFGPAEPSDPELRADGASFVTLERSGALRGCIGMLDAVRPLYLDVAHNATQAMNDPRLPAVTADEWGELDITVSVLSTSTPMRETGITALAGALRPGIDGLILSEGARRATFLPAVWHKVPDPERFVTGLIAKGGWSREEADGLTARRYVVAEFTHSRPRPSLEQLALPDDWTATDGV